MMMVIAAALNESVQNHITDDSPVGSNVTNRIYIYLSMMNACTLITTINYITYKSKANNILYELIK